MLGEGIEVSSIGRVEIVNPEPGQPAGAQASERAQDLIQWKALIQWNELTFVCYQEHGMGNRRVM